MIKLRSSAFSGIVILTALMLLHSPAPAAIPHQTAVYGEAGGEKQRVDIYGANPAKQQPALIWIHGGGWMGGGRTDIVPGVVSLTALGYVLFSIDYRLAAPGQNKYPAQLDDCQRAVRWIRAHAGEYGVDPAHIGALGESAGGHLAALLGTMDTRDNSDATLAAYSSRVQCVVDLYGPADLAPAGAERGPENEVALQIMENFIGASPETGLDKYRAASPVAHVDKHSAPFLIFHGAGDPLVPATQSQALDAALEKAGVETKLIIFPGEGHGFTNAKNLETVGQEVVPFLRRHLQSANGAPR